MKRCHAQQILCDKTSKLDYVKWNAKIQTSEIGKTPKSECLTVWISVHSNFRRSTLKFPRNLSEIGTFGYQQFGPKPNNFGPICPKSKRFMSEIRTKLFGLGFKNSNRTIISEIQTFCPICPNPDFKHSLYCFAIMFTLMLVLCALFAS